MKTSTNDYLFFGTNPSVLSFFASHTSFFFMGDSKSSSLLLAKCLNCSLLNSFCCQTRLTSSLSPASDVVFSGEESVELLDTDRTEGRLEVTGPILILNLRLLMLSLPVLVSQLLNYLGFESILPEGKTVCGLQSAG